MKKFKKLVYLFLALLLVFTTIACSNSRPSEQVNESHNSTIVFTDDTGRDVEISANMERIVPSGPLAQVVLYTLSPDKMVGLTSEFDDSQGEYIDPKLDLLPVLGNFYGNTLNMETVLTTEAQILVDIGEAKGNIKEDIEGIQDKTGIPSIFIHMDLDNMAEAYRKLGQVLGEEEQAEKLALYIEETLSDVTEKASTIPEEDKVKVYYGQGDSGLSAIVKGTVHSDVIDIVGGLNVSDIGENVRGGASDISMEQLLLWQADIVLFAPGSIYDDVDLRPEWEEINGIKDNKYYEIPDGLYNWMGRPPSVNRIIGVKWLGNLLYPEIFQYDMRHEVKEFYKLFYHHDITDLQIDNLLKNSTFK